MNEQHQMILEREYPSGDEDWYCPTCGRRFIVNWEPKFKKTVLQVGDEYASHSGGKGGLKMGPMPVMPVDTSISEESEITIEDPSLAPWAAWLDKIGFENLWNDEV